MDSDMKQPERYDHFPEGTECMPWFFIMPDGTKCNAPINSPPMIETNIKFKIEIFEGLKLLTKYRFYDFDYKCPKIAAYCGNMAIFGLCKVCQH